jgi:hypothetical protein
MVELNCRWNSTKLDDAIIQSKITAEILAEQQAKAQKAN